MRYLYIGGLEHSGTTLLSQALASHQNVLSLGEVGQFLSKSHMREYLRRWQAFPDVSLCSCGKDWSLCEFWSGLMPLNGAFEEDHIAEGYRQVLMHLQSVGENRLVVDSSKSRQYLKAFRTAWQGLGMAGQEDGHEVDHHAGLVIVAKDPRGFAASVSRKSRGRATLFSHYRAMNWWQGVYRRWLEYQPESPFRIKPVLYEQICLEPRRVLESIGNLLGIRFQAEIQVSHSKSHIALGNKDFIERNRERIEYDRDWAEDWQIQAAYLLNVKARESYSRFRQRCS